MFTIYMQFLLLKSVEYSDYLNHLSDLKQARLICI